MKHIEHLAAELAYLIAAETHYIVRATERSTTWCIHGKADQLCRDSRDGQLLELYVVASLERFGLLEAFERSGVELDVLCATNAKIEGLLRPWSP